MELLIESLLAEWHQLLGILPRIVLALVAFVVIFTVGRLAARGVEQVVRRSDLPQTHGGFFRKLVVWLFSFVGILIALNLLGLRALAAGLMTGGGVTAVVLGFAFREIGENFLAGFFLAFSRPFRIGDLIETGGLGGTVQGIELRYTHVRSADGRDIFIPSAHLFKNPLINFTRDGLRRFSFTVGIDYGDDPVRATELLREAVEGVDGVLSDPAPGIVIAGLRDAWVELQVFYWVNTFNPVRGSGAVQTDAMGATRTVLLNNGYTLSCDTVSNQSLATREPLAVAVAGAGA